VGPLDCFQCQIGPLKVTVSFLKLKKVRKKSRDCFQFQGQKCCSESHMMSKR